MKSTLVRCPTCGTRVSPEAMIRAAERQTRERQPTGCLECAITENRPYTLTVSSKQARAFHHVIDAHCNAALDAVPEGALVDVREDEIAAELFEREAKRLRAGGDLPHFTWRTRGPARPKKSRPARPKRKGSR